MNNDIETGHAMLIPNTPFACKALLSWVANRCHLTGSIVMAVSKSRTMLKVSFPAHPGDKKIYLQAREFIDNFIKQ